MDAATERPVQSTRDPARTFGSKENGTHPREGEIGRNFYPNIKDPTWLITGSTRSKLRRPQKNLVGNVRVAGVSTVTARLEATTVAIPGEAVLVAGVVARKHDVEEEEEEEAGAGIVLVPLLAADATIGTRADTGHDMIFTFPVIVVAAVVGGTTSSEEGHPVDPIRDLTRGLRRGLPLSNRFLLVPGLTLNLTLGPRHGTD